MVPAGKESEPVEEEQFEFRLRFVDIVDLTFYAFRLLLVPLLAIFAAVLLLYLVLVFWGT